ncbi:MAG: acetate uptake transporter [Gammaproteobacteria bacterium]
MGEAACCYYCPGIFRKGLRSPILLNDRHMLVRYAAPEFQKPILEKYVTETNQIVLLDSSANPAPLGLCAFGLTTVLLNLHNAGFYGLDTMILAMGIFYGGIAQVIAGIMEWKKGNTFATTAFTSYGLFWLSLVGLIVLPKADIGVLKPDAVAMSAYLAMWGVFTAVLFIATLKLSRALQAVFLTLTILFFMLAIGDAVGGDAGATLKTIAGYEGIACGVLAIYAGLAQVLNEVYGRTIWPLG